MSYITVYAKLSLRVKITNKLRFVFVDTGDKKIYNVIVEICSLRR